MLHLVVLVFCLWVSQNKMLSMLLVKDPRWQTQSWRWNSLMGIIIWVLVKAPSKMATLLYQPYTSSVPGFFCFVINNFLPIYKNFKNFFKKTIKYVWVQKSLFGELYKKWRSRPQCPIMNKEFEMKTLKTISFDSCSEGRVQCLKWASSLVMVGNAWEDIYVKVA